VLTWASRYQKFAPVKRIEVERVKFDTTLMQNPEVAGVEYQQGELAGWETRAYLMRQKMVAGFVTGDRIKACIPAPYKAEGTHIGRVAVRKTGAFVVQTTAGKVDNIYARFCTLLQRADGYDYAICSDNPGTGSVPPPSKKEHLLPSLAEAQGYPQAESL
jgi:hypothetical protein